METGCQLVPKMFSVTFLSGFCPQTIWAFVHVLLPSGTHEYMKQYQFGITFIYYPVHDRSVMHFSLKDKNVKECIRMGIIALKIVIWGGK